MSLFSSRAHTKTPGALPEYRLRVSGRARRVSLRVAPGLGLEVVLPEHADPACVPDLLRRHRGWIEKQLARLGAAAPGPQAPPARILLNGGLEEVLLRGLPGPAQPEPPAGAAPRPGLPRSAFDLAARLRPESVRRRELRLPPLPETELFPWLRGWLREEAGLRLLPALDELARQHGFAYARAALRAQRTRWGSCSARGSISLNVCLVFLPEALVRHVLLHELCHTRHLNHSAAFWRCLFEADARGLANDRALRRAWKYVPAWALER